MDPCLETPEIWRDFHNNFASEIQAALNRTLPRRYVARLNQRVASVYERDAYERIIDYRQPPPPPLTDEEVP